MKTYNLTAVKDLVTGEIGLLFDGCKLIETPMVSLEGRLLAHDLIEHINGLSSIGSIDDELQAVGAAWYVRGQFDDLSRDGTGLAYSPQQNLAYDIVNLCEIYQNGVDFRVGVEPTDDPYVVGDVFDHMIELAKKVIEVEDQDRFDDFFKSCLGYLLSGFYKADKKYGNAMSANHIFWEIASTIDRGLKYVDELHEGMEFELSVDFDTHVVVFDEKCDEFFEDEEE